MTFGLVGGTYGATGLGIIDGGQILAIASVVLGIAAMAAALIVKNQLQKKKSNINRDEIIDKIA